jgi:biotin transport system substrate-specific component
MSSARTAPAPTLVLADLLSGSWARDVALVAAGAGLTGAAAQVAISTPLSPVPFTLQTFAVLVTGAALGSVRGLLSMLLYLAVGAAGVPWFASHSSGWGGSSFGYVIGFVVAAFVVGRLAERRADRHVLSTVAMMVLGNVVIYVVGAAWLARDLGLTAGQAIDLGVRPFLATDAVKIGVAALALPGTWKLAGR